MLEMLFNFAEWCSVELAMSTTITTRPMEPTETSTTAKEQNHGLAGMIQNQ